MKKVITFDTHIPTDFKLMLERFLSVIYKFEEFSVICPKDEIYLKVQFYNQEEADLFNVRHMNEHFKLFCIKK